MRLQVHPASFLLDAQLALGHRDVFFVRWRALKAIRRLPLSLLLAHECLYRNDKAIAFRIHCSFLLSILDVLDIACGRLEEAQCACRPSSQRGSAQQGIYVPLVELGRLPQEE